MRDSVGHGSDNSYDKSYPIFKYYRNLSLNISFVGDNDFFSTIISKSYNQIIYPQTSLTASAESYTIYENGEQLITATLKDYNSNPISNKLVTFYRGNSFLKEAYTNDNGEVTYNYTYNQGSGTLNIRYEGDETTYDSCSTSITITTIARKNSTTTLNSNSTSVYIDDTITLTATGKGTVRIGTTSGGSDIATGNGTASGTYKVKSSCWIYAESSGDNEYYGASNKIYITATTKPVEKTSTSITISGSTSVTTGSTNTYKVTTSGIPSGSMFIWYVDGSLHSTGTSGTAKISFSSNGNHTIKVVYGGDDTHKSCEHTINVSSTTPVSKKNQTISITASPTSPAWETSHFISGVILDSDGNAVKNKSITVTIDGTNYNTTTGTTGVYGVSYTTPSSVKTYTVKVTSASNDGLNASSNSISVTTRKRKSYVKGTPTSLSTNDKFYGELYDETGADIVGHSVTTYYRGSTESTSTQRGTTNGTTDWYGKFYAGALTGTFKATLVYTYSYGGSDLYEGVSGSTNVSFNQ